MSFDFRLAEDDVQVPIVITVQEEDGEPTVVATKSGVCSSVICWLDKNTGELVLPGDVSEDFGFPLTKDGRIKIRRG